MLNQSHRMLTFLVPIHQSKSTNPKLLPKNTKFSMKNHDFFFKKRMTTSKINAVSSISAINVEMPFIWQSEAPIRVKMPSIMLISALEHGTKHPIWAMITINAVWYRNLNFLTRFSKCKLKVYSKKLKITQTYVQIWLFKVFQKIYVSKMKH